MASGLGVRTVYDDTPVGTDDWVVLVSNLAQTVNYVTAWDSSGQTMEIGVCAAGASDNAEVRQFLIPPGGISAKIQISSGQRISIRAVSDEAVSGENNLNVLF